MKTKERGFFGGSHGGFECLLLVLGAAGGRFPQVAGVLSKFTVGRGGLGAMSGVSGWRDQKRRLPTLESLDDPDLLDLDYPFPQTFRCGR